MSQPIQVVKIGGKLINDKASLQAFLKTLNEVKQPTILVHGGGRKATEISALLGIETRMVDGRRVTSKETLEVAIMIYAGLINKSIVASLQADKRSAIGLCGADMDIIRAVKRPVGEIDFGFVGDVTSVNADALLALLDKGTMPVLCAISHDGAGQLLNTNADTIAAQTAIALTEKNFEVHLSYCFEYPGVLYDIDQPTLTMSTIAHQEFGEMKEAGTINAGMIPKLQNGFDAVKVGAKVSICGIDNLVSKEKATHLTL